MNPVDHDRSLLGAYALGALDPLEAQLVHDHLAGCPDCRREVADLNDLRAALDEVPPEAFLDGPPDGGDLLLRRTVRAARAETAAPARQAPPRRRLALVAAAVLALVAVGRPGPGRASPYQPAPGASRRRIRRRTPASPSTSCRRTAGSGCTRTRRASRRASRANCLSYRATGSRC